MLNLRMLQTEEVPRGPQARTHTDRRRWLGETQVNSGASELVSNLVSGLGSGEFGISNESRKQSGASKRLVRWDFDRSKRNSRNSFANSRCKTQWQNSAILGDSPLKARKHTQKLEGAGKNLVFQTAFGGMESLPRYLNANRKSSRLCVCAPFCTRTESA